jgi:hypothetical protein
MQSTFPKNLKTNLLTRNSRPRPPPFKVASLFLVASVMKSDRVQATKTFRITPAQKRALELIDKNRGISPKSIIARCLCSSRMI